MKFCDCWFFIINGYVRFGNMCGIGSLKFVKDMMLFLIEQLCS